MGKQENRCFIITPIGGESDPIRRHIDGIIDAAIRPALGDKYAIIVAHKMNEPGSITRQIISEIYNAKLVIANLTNRNPNVMYELAFRHCVGKPTIMIAEAGTSLPADIIMERTIFYKNDAQGVLELRMALQKAENEIDFSKTGSPIHDVLQSINRDANIIQVSQDETRPNQEVLPYILDKLNRLEDIISSNKHLSNASISPIKSWYAEIRCSDKSKDDIDEVYESVKNVIHGIPEIYINAEAKYKDTIQVVFDTIQQFSKNEILRIFEHAFNSAGLNNIIIKELMGS